MRKRIPLKPPKKDNVGANAESRPGTRLNKYISNVGVCARRKADELIKSGKITVNGKVITEMGYKVQQGDQVFHNGKVLKTFVKKIYVLLNKPKNVITTTHDEKDRKTVLDLIRGIETERLFPVGRLDRNTTGLLLLTNDGELAQKLSHPSKQVMKIYQVTTDKPVTLAHLNQMAEGINLDDGIAKADEIAFADSHDKRVIGIQIHSGKNRVVRRMFEHLGYSVEKLDRVMFAGLTKKNLPRGKWRHLSEQELSMLWR